MQGLFLFNKPSGISSAGFLNQIKKKLTVSKVGHGGTLDPMAEGVLVVAISRRYTKMLSHTLKSDTKTYIATIGLGVSSDTYDKEGALTHHTVKIWPTQKQIEKVIKEIQTHKTQTPPPFSALKIKGKPAYAYARKGETVALKPRPAHLLNYKITSTIPTADEVHTIEIEMEVSAGFYIRSFAHELGEILGTGAHLTKLVRTKVGDFDINYALTLKDLDDTLQLCTLQDNKTKAVKKGTLPELQKYLEKEQEKSEGVFYFRKT